MRPRVLPFWPLPPASFLFLLHAPFFSFVRIGGAFILTSNSSMTLFPSASASPSTSIAFALKLKVKRYYYIKYYGLHDDMSQQLQIFVTVRSWSVVGAIIIFRRPAISSRISARIKYELWQFSCTNRSGAKPCFMATAMAHAQGNL